MLSTLAVSAQKVSPSIKWKFATELPPSRGQSKSLGFAGVINGVSNNVLIVAGGANFPHGLPWEGGKKYYTDEIHVLQKDGVNFIWNKKVIDKLPEPIGYCGSTSTDRGIAYVGGENENGISNRCYLLRWNNQKERVDIKVLPNLPVALTNIALTHIGNTLYAVGGDEEKISSSSFYSLNLDDAEPQWQTVTHLPIALANATAVFQYVKNKKEIFVIGGRSKSLSGVSDLHHTVYAFNIDTQKWSECADISNGKYITNLSAACGVALGKDKILIIGGDNGKIFHQIESYIAQITKAKTPEEKVKLTEEKNDLSIHHRGFDKSVLLYDTNSDVWTKIGDLPFPAQVTTTAVMWNNDIVISNGEIRPGVRTPNIMIGKIGR